MKQLSNFSKDLEEIPISEIFILFALVSLALFPLFFLINKVVADSGFVFTFICLSIGVVLKMVKVGGWAHSFKFGASFKYVKLMIFGLLSLVLISLGYMGLWIIGALFFLVGMIGMVLLSQKMKNKPVFRKNEEEYSFGKKDLYCIGALLLLTLFSIRNLLTTEPIVYWDWSGFGLDDLDAFRLWDTHEIFRLIPPSPFVFFSTPLMLFLGNEIVSNIFVLVWIPLASLTFYCFAARMIRNRPAGFVASLVYVFNPAVLDRFLSGHMGMLIGYAVMPLILILFVSALENQRFKISIGFSLMAGVLLAISGLMQNHFFYLHALLLILFLIFYSAMNISYRNLRNGIFLLILVFFTAVIVASPWLLPTLKLAESGYFSGVAKLNYPLYLSTQTYLYNAFRLIGQTGALFMGNVGYTGLSIWPLLGFVTVFLGFSSLLLHKKGKEKIVLIFSLIALIGVVLSTGTMYLGLYQWLYQNFPFFVAFREPSKFLVIAGFGLSMLVGIAVDGIMSFKGPNIRSTKFLVPLVLSMMLLSQGIFAWPMFTGSNLLYSQHPKYIMSEEYRELGAWIDSQEGSLEVIILPYTGFTIRTWHFVSKKEIEFIGLGSLSPMNSSRYQYSIFMFETIGRGDTQGFATLAGLQSIKYVVIQKDLDLRQVQETPDDYGYLPPFNRFNLSGPLLVQLLEESSEFEKRHEFGPYVVFENKRFIKRNAEKKPILAVGDRNLILEMAKRPDFDFSKNKLIFANQLRASELVKLINSTDVISNSDENELMFSQLDSKYKVDIYDYAYPAGLGDDPKNIVYKKWIRSDIFEFLEGGVFGNGAVTYGRGYAITKGDAILKVSFNSIERGRYQLWARLLYAPNNGNFSVFLDDEKIGEVSTKSPEFKGFVWVDLGEVNVAEGMHDIEVVNSHGKNALDQIAFLAE